MNSDAFGMTPKPIPTMADAHNSISHSERLSEGTKKDYLAQIQRCRAIFNANDLSDISADPMAFLSRFTKKSFPADHFKTYKAYLAWRKKMTSIMKHLLGTSQQSRDRRALSDAWTDIKDEWIKIHSPKHKGHIAIDLLTDEARKSGLSPQGLSKDWLIDLMDDLDVSRRRGIPRAIQLLEEARADSPAIDKLLGSAPLPNPSILRRARVAEIPDHLDQQLLSLAEALCAGEIDEISNEFVGGKAKATFYTYRAAARKYVATALACDALPADCQDIAESFDKKIFIEVLRNWIGEDRREHQITDRSMRSYVSKIIPIAASLGKDVSFMKKALDINPNLKNGRAEANTMPLDTRAFCSRLLRFRNAEMTFKSLHIRFQQQAISLMSADTPGPYSAQRIVQLGTIAVFAAIALWGVPLRIGNMRSLRHRGGNPTLVLPHGARQRAHLLIPAPDVKNRKPIKAHISDGPTRALEILEWYLEEIRPRMPWADHSSYLFPGETGELISTQSLRNWIQDHSRDLGIPMDPHNFRHGLATLYLRDHPGDYSGAARLLCNTPETVRAHYAWIDEEGEMRKVQEAVARMGGFRHGC